MRRVLLLMAIAAMILALTAGPALAVQQDAPGNEQEPEDSTAQPTEQQGENCYGSDASNFVKGPGEGDKPTNDFPASNADPVKIKGQETFNGEVTRSVAQEGELDDFQQATREESASCGDTGSPS